MSCQAYPLQARFSIKTHPLQLLNTPISAFKHTHSKLTCFSFQFSVQTDTHLSSQTHLFLIILTLPLQQIQTYNASYWMLVSIVYTVSIKGYRLPLNKPLVGLGLLQQRQNVVPRFLLRLEQNNSLISVCNIKIHYKCK